MFGGSKTEPFKKKKQEMTIKENLKCKTTIYVSKTLTSHLAKIITMGVVISQQRK